MTFTLGIAGITGKFARRILARLLKQTPELQIRGYCRQFKNLPVALLTADNVQIVQGAHDDIENIHTFVQGCDVVICCYLGGPDVMTNGQKFLIDACEEAGVPRYIASDYSLDYTGLDYGDIPPKDAMKDVLEYISTKKSVRGVHVLIGGFMETLFSPFFGLYDAQDNVLSYWGDEESVWESTTYGNAADFVAKIALDPEATGFQRFIGDRKTTIQIGQALREVYGQKPTLKNRGSLQDLRARIKQLRDRDPVNVFSYLALSYQYYCLTGKGTIPKQSENTKYSDIQHESFQDFFRGRSRLAIPFANAEVGSSLVI
ncbi:hypothetical protein BJY01DRAFT_248465 [Aspergillus pseudoustus]|uniref:NAD(P)-binding domain-containing protein n=1 Tax=Aspergillus pseudoustus TaxID=1810923 RepID=A0ABR4JUG8_9EURO